MPGARRRHQSGRHRAHDELFGPTAARWVAPGEGPAGREAAEPSASLLRRLAEEADASGRLADAVSQYVRLLIADPLDVGTRIALAHLHERAEHPDNALAVLDEGLARRPDDPELLLARGRAHAQQRHHAEAEADLRRLLRLHPAHAPGYFELGLILVRRGRAADAAEAFAQAIACGPESAQTYTELAEALNQSGRLADAVAALERAVALGPAEPRAFNLLGRVLDRLQRSDEATLMYRRARELADR